MRFEYSDFYRKMGLNIAYYRKDRGLTQKALADALNIDESHLSKIERASVGISLDMLFDIAHALDIQACKLLEFRE